MDEKSHQIREIFGKNLKRARKAKKMTQDEMSAEIGVQRNTISMYEGGNSMPGETVIQKILSALDISRESLFDNVMQYDFSSSAQSVNESIGKYSIGEDMDILEYLVNLESKNVIPSELLANIKTLAMRLYKERADDKEELVNQMKKYEKLRDLIDKKEKLGLQ